MKTCSLFEEFFNFLTTSLDFFNLLVRNTDNFTPVSENRLCGRDNSYSYPLSWLRDPKGKVCVKRPSSYNFSG